MAKLVLIITENPVEMSEVVAFLEKEGYFPTLFDAPLEAPAAVVTNSPAFVILEQELRSVDGLELCKRVRQLSNVPVIMVAAHRRRVDVIAALTSGADDYIVKPVDNDELLARMRAIARRGSQSPGPSPRYTDGEWRIDFLQREVWVGERKVQLSATEFNVLAYLVRNAGRVVPMSELLTAVWGPDCAEDFEYVRLYVWYLRQKLEKDPRRPKRILTKRGVGYIFERRSDRNSRPERRPALSGAV
ncbi:MAG: response regulator transcription factor [Chloroflexi bacterium]|nr:response regulator transcription factor [Chloroflexota bacterium]